MENPGESAMPRPLFRETTDELEQMFRECGNSPEQLRILAEELRHRERPKAVALNKKIEAALLQTDSDNAQPASASENSGMNTSSRTETRNDQAGQSQRQS
ncbi:MAG: hypothetical protein ABSG80_10375 [Verrucomicrobiota bacterium]